MVRRAPSYHHPTEAITTEANLTKRSTHALTTRLRTTSHHRGNIPPENEEAHIRSFVTVESLKSGLTYLSARHKLQEMMQLAPNSLKGRKRHIQTLFNKVVSEIGMMAPCVLCTCSAGER